MKKILLGFGFESLGVITIATPLLLTSCSKLKNITIDVNEIVYDESSESFTYSHDFFGSTQNGFINIGRDVPLTLIWNVVLDSQNECVIFGKTKAAIDVYVDMLYFDDHYDHDGDWTEDMSNKLKKGEVLEMKNGDTITKIKCMLVNNYEEVYTKLDNAN